MLQELLAVLGNELSEQKIKQLLSEVADRLIATYLPGIEELPPSERISRLLDAMQKAGALSEVKKENEYALVKGCSCPLSDVVVSHPGICGIAAEILSKLLGKPVSERCERSTTSRCCFQIAMNT